MNDTLQDDSRLQRPSPNKAVAPRRFGPFALATRPAGAPASGLCAALRRFQSSRSQILALSKSRLGVAGCVAAPVVVLAACSGTPAPSEPADTGPLLPNTPPAATAPAAPTAPTPTTPPNTAGPLGGLATSESSTEDLPLVEQSSSESEVEAPTTNTVPEETTPEGPPSPLLPIIPPIDGDCPTFTSGTKTVNGLRGISFRVGEKVEGTPTGPLVFYWHGTGSSSFEGNRFPGIEEIVDQGGVFVAFSRSTGSGGDCSGTGTFSQDDFKIADQIVACAVRDHNIDARRIYATGCSAGGLFAGCMAIERSSYLAATVPNSGGITIGYGAIQDPTRVPASMTMHGGRTDNVIVAFSETSKAYSSHMLKQGSPMVVNCDHRGGHCAAPSALYRDGWEFMKAHPFGITESPYANGLPEGFSSSCEVWTDTSLTPYGQNPTEVKSPATGTEWEPPSP